MSLTKEERAPLGGLSESQEAGTEIKSLTEKVHSTPQLTEHVS